MDERHVSPTDELARLADAILKVRRFRSACLPEELFGGEQPWDMLLVLFIADTEGRRLTGGQAIEMCGGSANAGSRWLKVLTESRLIVGDGQGRLEDPVTLTPAGIDKMEHWLSEANVVFARQQT